jgi:hypothetical protein
LKAEGQARPDQGGKDGAMDKTQVYGDAGQGQEGKKKLPPASRMMS